MPHATLLYDDYRRFQETPYDSISTISYSTDYLRCNDTSFTSSRTHLSIPRAREGGLYDDDFLMMAMCDSSGIMTAIQCLIQPKKPVMDLGRGGGGRGASGNWIVVFVFLACERMLI